MGEIGTPRREYLYELKFWEILLISRGYQRRHRDLWSASRWQTYNLMTAQVGSDNMKKSGINSPTDLIRFPWDTDRALPISQEEIDELQKEIDYFNNNRETEQQ